MSARLIVSVSGRRLAIPIDAIEEISERSQVTLLPLLPAAMPGVIDMRGRPIPVIDLGWIAGEEPRHDRQCVVVASDGTRPMALLIDGVEMIEEEDAVDATVPSLDLSALLEEIA